MSRLKTIIADLGGDIEIDYGNYVAAVFNSDLFGFADDFELRVDSEGRRIHIRSSARVGYSDFGVNRKRVERIRKRLRDET